MNNSYIPLYLIPILLPLLTFSQQNKGFQFGLYAGAFFANNSTATIYNGYGYDIEGNKNNFENSWLKHKINNEYGGGNGQPDRIAKELGVNTTEWYRITEKDMPINMQYAPSFAIGLHTRYNVDKKTSVSFNFTSMRLSATGNFTIELTPSVNQSGNTWSTKNIQTFQILGKEQRFNVQAGLQQYLTDNEIFNFFVEAGPLLNYIKLVRNHAIVNTLDIDLTRHYLVDGGGNSVEVFRARNMADIDFGFFAGIGLNLNTNSNWMAQVVYNPSYERVGIGEQPGPFLQHTIGVRMYKLKGEL